MNRNTLFSSLCLVALACLPAAKGGEFDTPKKNEPALEAIQKQLLDIQVSLQSLKAQDTEVRLRRLEQELTSIREQLKSIESTVKASNSKVETRIAGSINPPGTNPAPIAPAPVTGTIRLSNTSAFYASVNLNGLVYRVAPGQVLPVTNQAAGDFRYEVLADGFGMIQPPTMRTLGANEIFTIFIYPR